jgi:hypothetical protein
MSARFSALRVIMRANTAGTSASVAVRVMNSAHSNLPPLTSANAAAQAAGV